MNKSKIIFLSEGEHLQGVGWCLLRAYLKLYFKWLIRMWCCIEGVHLHCCICNALHEPDCIKVYSYSAYSLPALIGSASYWIFCFTNFGEIVYNFYLQYSSKIVYIQMWPRERNINPAPLRKFVYGLRWSRESIPIAMFWPLIVTNFSNLLSKM